MTHIISLISNKQAKQPKQNMMSRIENLNAHIDDFIRYNCEDLDLYGYINDTEIPADDKDELITGIKEWLGNGCEINMSSTVCIRRDIIEDFDTYLERQGLDIDDILRARDIGRIINETIEYYQDNFGTNPFEERGYSIETVISCYAYYYIHDKDEEDIIEYFQQANDIMPK